MAIHAPITGAPSRAPSNDTLTKWEAARAAEEFARSAMDRYRTDIIDPALAAQKAGMGTFEQAFDAEEGWAPYTSAHADALDAVILTPAPTLADVVFKLELGLSDGVFDGSDDSTRMLGVVADDLRRLSRPTAKAIWDDLMTRYLAAKAEEDDYAARVHDPMFEDNSCADTDERRAVADEMERLASIRHALMLNLVRATAPDQSALLWKLEWLLNERDSMCWSDAVLDPIQHDVRRILNREIQSGQ